MEARAALYDLKQQIAEVDATGVLGVGSYRQWAAEHGYTHVEDWNTTSSAGDWQFLVSKDEIKWRILTQENNWPRPGFSYYLGETMLVGPMRRSNENYLYLGRKREGRRKWTH